MTSPDQLQYKQNKTMQEVNVASHSSLCNCMNVSGYVSYIGILQ